MKLHCRAGLFAGLMIGICVRAAAADTRAPGWLDSIDARVMSTCRKMDRMVLETNAQPAVRDLTACALGELELGENPAPAERLMRHAFALQNMDPQSPEYGTVPWQEGHAEIKDANAIEFTMLPVGPILLNFSNRLSAEFLKEATPHVRAGIAAVSRHPVRVTYSNIYLMKICNLLLLGQAVGDAESLAEGRTNLDAWLDWTRAHGISEYDSPTYTPVQVDCVALAERFTSDAAVKSKLRAVLDYYWSDLAANYFPGTMAMAAPASRNYDFLQADQNANYEYYLAGIRAEPPGGTLISDAVRCWFLAREGGYWPSKETIALAAAPERVVRSRFGALTGQDRYLYLTRDFAIGSASAYYGEQDRSIAVEVASAKNLPTISFVPDRFDGPFGTARTRDRSGHPKPTHLPFISATVQDKGMLLAIFDLAPALKDRQFTNLASNILLPAGVEQLQINGPPVNARARFVVSANRDSVVIVREGKAAVAARLFFADGCAGQKPVWELRHERAEDPAARLVVYHYRGPERGLDEKNVRCGLLLMAEQCTNEEEYSAFQESAAKVQLAESTNEGVWEVRATSGDTVLEAGLDLKRGRIALRRVNGMDWETDVFNVNGRDMTSLLPQP